MKKIAFICLLVCSANIAFSDIYTTEFRSGLSLMPTYVSGGFSASIVFSGTSFDILGDSQYDLDTDPVVRAIGTGTITLSFNQTVTSISFDIGGLDGGDSTTFSLVPSLSAPQNTTQHFTASSPTLSEMTIIGNGGSGTRVTFSGLEGNSFSWSNTGSGWIFYDHFEFSTDAVPEPASAMLLFGGMGVIGFIRRWFGWM